MPLPFSLDLARLNRAYASGALSPTHVVEQALAEIAATRESNRAWIHVAPRDALLARAAELRERWACGERLPLHGVPFAVKDNIDVAGHPTTAACPAFSYVAPTSAHVVQRLENAGAILIGKTNLDQFAAGLVGTRSPYGACANPFDARYISGGSSSGSAAAVALGHVSFALGTDTAGSGRVPAGFCNVVGLKPSRGLISTAGVVPACRTLDCVSIFALTAEDAVAVFDVARGHDTADPYSRSDAPVPPEPLPERFRCGVPQSGELQFFGDAIAGKAFERALRTLEGMGARLVEIDYAPFAETARLLYEGPWLAERLAAIKPFFERSAADMYPVTRDIIGRAREYSAVDAFDAQYRLQDLKSRSARQWDAIDVLAVPTAPTIYRIAEVADEPVRLNGNLGYYTNFVNLLDLAALAVPGDFRSDGLPAGITLIAPALQDLVLAELGARFQRSAPQRLGATPYDIPEAARAPRTSSDRAVALAVAGAQPLPLNSQLTQQT